MIPLSPISRRLTGIVVASVLAGSSLLALQPQGRSVNDGVYTAAQATRGQALYTMHCASCHGANLIGSRVGPPLIGDEFAATWHTQPVVELANKIGRTMPRNTSDRLTPQQTADVVAYILQVAKFPAGRAELVMDEAALKLLNFPTPAALPKVAAAPMPTLPPAGNMSQVMRGLLFPSSNIIFTVQTIDPGAKRPEIKDDPANPGMDFFAWGQNIYTGWDVVDYASITLAESAQLMLTPGRKCENGRPVPVSDPDWIKFTNELAEAGKAAYKASQSRNQEAVSKSTDQLNNSCSNCHRVYRGRTHCVRA
jgi:mono/diheme cytochrome c family protein